MEDSKLSYKFSGILWGTIKYGVTDGPFLRQPFWRSYNEFLALKEKLNGMFALDLPFPIERPFYFKLPILKFLQSKQLQDRKEGLEEFLKACLWLPDICETKAWIDFINPLHLDSKYYFREPYQIVNLIEFGQNVEVYRIRSKLPISDSFVADDGTAKPLASEPLRFCHRSGSPSTFYGLSISDTDTDVNNAMTKEFAIKSIGLAKAYLPQIRNEIRIHQELDYKHCLKFQGYNIDTKALIITRLANRKRSDFGKSCKKNQKWWSRRKAKSSVCIDLHSSQLQSCSCSSGYCATKDGKMKDALERGSANGSRLNLVLEVAKKSVLQAIESTQGAPESSVKKWFYQFMLGLSYLHHQGVCHRDLKPQNLLLMEDGTLKICDYGFAFFQRNSAGENTDPSPEASCGSLFYVAPEVLLDKPYNGFRADIWSSGVVLFSMLAGERLFDEETIMTFSDEAQDFLQFILSKDPRERPTCQEILRHNWLSEHFQTADLDEILATTLIDYSATKNDVIADMGRWQEYRFTSGYADIDGNTTSAFSSSSREQNLGKSMMVSRHIHINDINNKVARS